MRQQIAAANWKMNLDYDGAKHLLNELFAKDYNLNANRKVVIAVPFPYLVLAVEHVKGKEYIYIAAQNCSSKKSGAYTGETSVDMLKSVGVEYVVLGHSERREYFNESNSFLAEKTNIVLENNLTPIFCCGESLNIREADTQNDFVANQLKESLFHLTAEQISKVVIAYEPIWAIGTGKTASSQQAQDMHLHIRNTFAAQYGQEIADRISILYGGSVKGNNAAELFAMPDVDGGLVGGASLNAEEFATIINALQ